MNSLQDKVLQNVLSQLHKDAKKSFYKAVIGFIKGKLSGKLTPDHMKEAHLEMSEEQGKIMYGLIVASQSKNIVEFGTSFGISTLYLAAAAKDNGGKVITTELLQSKCEAAKINFANANLSEYIELREGDAMVTLYENLPENIDFLLLDGWKDLYLPLFQMLEPRLIKGTIIITDNTNFKEVKLFLNYLRLKKDKYFSIPLSIDKGSSEFSVVLN